MNTLKNYIFIFIVMLATVMMPAHGMKVVKGGMNYLRGKAYPLIGIDMQGHADLLGISMDASYEEVENAYQQKNGEIDTEYNQNVTQANQTYAQRSADFEDENRRKAIEREHTRKVARLHPDLLNRRDRQGVIDALKPYYPELAFDTKTEQELRALAEEQIRKLNEEHNDFNNAGLKKDQDISDAGMELNAKKASTQEAYNTLNRIPFYDLYIIGGISVLSVATIMGLIKGWHWYREYRSPNTVLLEKMIAAAIKSTTLILNLQFDRYNPTKDTDVLSLQFDIEPLLEQLSSDEVRTKVRHAIMAFDKTLEATYEQCAWHYDGITMKELAEQNPTLVREMLVKLKDLIDALKVCYIDLKLDRTVFQNIKDVVTSVKNKVQGNRPAKTAITK